MYGEQNYGGRCISVLSLGFAGWIQNDCNPSNAQRQWDFVLSECTGEYTTRPFPYVDTRIARHWPTHTVSSTPVWKLSARVHSLNCSILFPFSYSRSLSLYWVWFRTPLHARPHSRTMNWNTRPLFACNYSSAQCVFSTVVSFFISTQLFGVAERANEPPPIGGPRISFD